MKHKTTLALTLLFVCISALTHAQVTIPNVVVDSVNYDGECTIIINRQSPSHILAASNPDIIYRSGDGGLTWTESYLSTFSSQNLVGDVTLATDHNGFFYYQSLDPSFYLYTLRSGDYGATWDTETFMGNGGNNEDKNWLVCDNVATSPYLGNLYCSWTQRPVSQTGRIFFSKSDNGSQSWLPYDTLVNENSSIPPIGTGMAVGAAGEINITWGGGSPNEISFLRSDDGGQTWLNAPVMVDDNVMPSGNYYSSIDHPISFSAQFTSLACDVSSGPHQGNLYCAWDDVRNGPDNADIFLATSTDDGQTWTTQRINDDVSLRNQVVPTVAVDPVTGWVYVAYLDARLNTDAYDDTLHYYLAWSSDGGQTFQNLQVSQQASTLNFIHSDYMGMDAYNGKIHLFWAGGEVNSNLQMWTAAVTQSILTSIEPEASINPVLLYPAYPNPSIDFTTFDFHLSTSTTVTLIITDMNGKEVTRVLNNEKYAAGQHQVRFDNQLSAGFYLATIITSEGNSTRKIAIVK